MVIKLIYLPIIFLGICSNYLFLFLDSNNSKESSIVSRYVSSMKKKPSLQNVINRARKHPYQRLVSNSHTPVSKNTSDSIQSIQTSSNKEIESV